MKVIIYYEQREYGGVDTFLYQLINNWPSKKDEFVIMTNSDNKGVEFLTDNLSNLNYTVQYIAPDAWYAPANKSIFFKMSSLFKAYLLFGFRFFKYINQLNPDIILISNGSYPGGFSTFIAAIISSFVSAPNLFLVHHAILYRSWSPVVITANILALIIKIINVKMITVSIASKKMLEKFTPLKNFIVIHNGLSRDKNICKINLRNKFDIATSEITLFGTIGRIDDFKGHINVIEAFSKSSFLKKNAHYLIVGRGNQKVVSQLTNLVSKYNLEENITFGGYVKGSPLDIVKGLDIFVMPTKDFEGFGYSYVEAMALEVPVVASNVGAIPEIIEDKVSGLLVDPNSINEWINALEFSIKNKDQTKLIAQRGKARIEGFFSAQKMSKNYHELFLDSINSQNPNKLN